MDILAELKKLGLEITYETKMGGGVDRNSIYSIIIPLSAEEWCKLCMRDEEFYVGGCCGQTSVIQDHYNGIFRASGAADAGDIMDLMQSAGSHDGFEEYSLTWGGDLEKLVKDWRKLTPVKKIGVCCQAVKEKLAKKMLRMPNPHRRTDDWCHSLEGSLRLMSYQDMIQRDGDKDQKHANREELLSRIYPACQKVLEVVIPKLSKPFEGFALTKGGTSEIVADGYGLCIYGSEKTAKAMMESWLKVAEEDVKPYLKRLEVKAVRVDAKAGVIFK